LQDGAPVFHVEREPTQRAMFHVEREPTRRVMFHVEHPACSSRHSGAGRNPGTAWTPAFAGVTDCEGPTFAGVTDCERPTLAGVAHGDQSILRSTTSLLRRVSTRVQVAS